jgi:U3 small nucleolar RNA-associated protein 4
VFVRFENYPLDPGTRSRQNRIAVGTEEGYISLFEVTDDGLLFDRTLDKQEGRVLCLAWHSSGNKIVSGSSDTIRVWNVLTGSPILRITTGRVEKFKETIVWSVKIMDDLTIISGDSRGKTW